MQKSKLASLVAVTAVMLILVPSMVFAQTAEDASAEDASDIEIGIDLGKQSLESASSGALAGIFLSTITVIGKHIRDKADKKPDPKKYGLNIIIGAISAVLVGIIPGINTLVGGEALSFAVAFALLYVVDVVIRPIYGSWAKGADAKAEEPKK